MEFAKLMSGGAPTILLFQIGEAMANRGVPVVVGGANNEGIALAATTTASDLVGITTDLQATLVTAQQTDNSDPAREVGVIVNPDAIYKVKCSGSSTSGTDLSTFTVTTASTDGLVVTAGDFNTVDLDEGSVHCITGANVGITRKITSTSSTAATVKVAFPNDIDVGDVFVATPFHPGEDQFVQLTSDLTELDCSVTTDTDNNNFRVLDVIFDGAGNTHALVMPFDSLYAAGGSI